jgi:polyisoprenoid-binding protein YceI
MTCFSARIRANETRETKRRMAVNRYSFDSVRSCVWVSGRSSLHPFNTETRGITGWFHTATRSDGTLDLDQAVSGELELAVERLTSGNQLYDRELRRRIDARRYPTIAGRLTGIVLDGSHPNYEVTGEVSFHGKTRMFAHGMQIEVSDRGIALTGEDMFDIREFGMKPPSMLMVRVYPEISVRVALHGIPDS